MTNQNNNNNRKIEFITRDRTITREDEEDCEKKASRGWFLLPFFFGIIGGIIMAAVLWHEDRESAKMGLVMGFVFGIMWAGILMLGLL